MPKRKQKNTKKITIWGVVLIALLLLTIGYFIKVHYDINYNAKVSAKPDAMVIKPYIEQTHAKVLHTYNRSKNAAVHSPSYEYYLELPSNDINTYRASFADFMRGHGYTSFSQSYIYDGNCNYLNNEEEYCAKLGYQTSLTGSTKNKGEPYWVTTGQKGDTTYHAELSTKTFHIRSSDVFRNKYGENVQPGKSVLTVTFGRTESR